MCLPATSTSNSSAATWIGSSRVRRKASDIGANHQRMDLMRAFIRIDRLQVDHVPEDRMLEADAVGAEHAAHRACDLERHRHVVALPQADLRGPQSTCILESPELVRQQLPGGDGL